MKDNKQDYLERLERLRPIDDIFMRAMFRDNRSLGEFVLRIILERPELKLTKFSVQADMKHVTGARSVVFDVLAEDSNGEVLSMEVQRETKGAEPYRARYNSSNIDIGKLKEGQKFEELPVKWVIFITEKDFFKDGAPIHHIHNMDKDTGKIFKDGANILYVNGEYRGDDPLGRLMHDFNCEDPEEMYNPEFRERARYLKKTEGGASTMCKEMEELVAIAKAEGIAEGKAEGIAEGKAEGIAEGKAEGKAEGIAEGKAEGKAEGRAEGKAEGRAEGKRTIVVNMLKAGKYDTEDIAEISGLTLEEIEELSKDM